MMANPRIIQLDLSCNSIGRSGALLLAKVFRDREPFLEWLDISRNNFHHIPNVINALVSGLKIQKNLYHLTMDVSPKASDPETMASFTSSERVSSLLLTNPKLRSLSLIDSFITEKAMKTIQKALSSQSRMVNSLNFKFSFLDKKNIFTLCRILDVSRTLVKLDLSSNQLPPVSGIYIMKAIQVKSILV